MKKGKLKKTKDKIKEFTNWEWSTLVASWRYYQYRSTIASATFPADIVSRYWGSGEYDAKPLDTIAHQFAHTDHGSRGEEDWSVGSHLAHCDIMPWCKFYAFCKAWCDGFATLTLDAPNGKLAEVKCFYCNYMKRWYSVYKYIENPSVSCYVDEGKILKIEEAGK